MAIPTLSLCSGVGMLDTGLRIAGDFRTVCYIEREAFAASQLATLMAARCLDDAPIWADLATFDGKPWRGKVDCIIGGLPCQPYSVAGKKIGNDDARSWGDGDGPIPNAIRIISEIRPTLVFFENVPAWVTGGYFAPVAEALSAMGYRVQKPLLLAAEDVGASHKRERCYVMAYRHSELWRTDSRESEPESNWRHDTGGRGDELADARHQSARAHQYLAGQKCETPTNDCIGRENVDHPADLRREWHASAGRETRRWAKYRGIGMAYTDGRRRRLQSDHQLQSSRVNRSGTQIFAPGPLDPQWTTIIAHHPHLAPAIKPRIRMLAYGATYLVDESRRNQLRAIGNGAVPLAFALAVKVLLHEAGIVTE